MALVQVVLPKVNIIPLVVGVVRDAEAERMVANVRTENIREVIVF
jgi:hypothetical protein